MDIHMATELAYKNGYEAGKQATAEQLIGDILKIGGSSLGVFLNLDKITELKEKYGVTTDDETNS